jgi:L-threonylcarbamoyladenylate synthase
LSVSCDLARTAEIATSERRKGSGGMRVLSPTEENLEEMLSILHAGEVLAVPTDTVYGLAVATRVPGSVKRLFEVKGRPTSLPIAVLVSDIKQAQSITGVWPSFAIRMAARYWPGPLTIVLQKAPGWDVYLGGEKDKGGGSSTVGVRQPDNSLVIALAKLAGPLATTSANLHGEAPCATANEIVERFSGKGVAAVVDGGELKGPPSTVVDCTSLEMRVVREGAVPREELERLVEENYS